MSAAVVDCLVALKPKRVNCTIIAEIAFISLALDGENRRNTLARQKLLSLVQRSGRLRFQPRHQGVEDLRHRLTHGVNQ